MMSSDKQGDDIVDVVYVLQNLGPALRAIRTARRLSLREVARQCQPVEMVSDFSPPSEEEQSR